MYIRIKDIVGNVLLSIQPIRKFNFVRGLKYLLIGPFETEIVEGEYLGETKDTRGNEFYVFAMAGFRILLFLKSHTIQDHNGIVESTLSQEGWREIYKDGSVRLDLGSLN